MISYKLIPGFNSQIGKFSPRFSKPAGSTAHWIPTVQENRSRARNVFCHWISFWNLNSDGLHKRERLHPLSKSLPGCYDSGFLPGDKQESQNISSWKGPTLSPTPCFPQGYLKQNQRTERRLRYGKSRVMAEPAAPLLLLRSAGKGQAVLPFPHYTYSDPMYSDLL